LYSYWRNAVVAKQLWLQWFQPPGRPARPSPQQPTPLLFATAIHAFWFVIKIRLSVWSHSVTSFVSDLASMSCRLLLRIPSLFSFTTISLSTAYYLTLTSLYGSQVKFLQCQAPFTTFILYPRSNSNWRSLSWEQVVFRFGNHTSCTANRSILDARGACQRCVPEVHASYSTGCLPEVQSKTKIIARSADHKSIG
jgi:hypothetical protein